ncbi:MAG: hypothetical protein PGN34_07635 [Methylobacterium frigidaeris]
MDANMSAALNEYLEDMPVAAATQSAMRRAVEAGTPPADVIEQAFVAVVGYLVETEGASKAAARLLSVAKSLAGTIQPPGIRPN